MIAWQSVRFRRACPEKRESLLRARPQLSPLLAELLVARGYDCPDRVDEFFHPTPELLHDPMIFKGMAQALAILRESLTKGEKILIHGDYDCDGICGTTLLFEALRETGAQVSYYLPDRFKEGYGLSLLAVEHCKTEGIDLLITVDCGSSSHREIEAAREYGIKVIVTDHHAVPEVPPTPDAFINPQQPDCPYPFKGICGTGVAFKLVQALFEHRGVEPLPLLDLVAVATVADVVPLQDENRAFVQYGLQELARSRRVGFTALLEVAGGSGREAIDSMAVGFTLGPRLNASGRIEHARLGVELLTSRSLAQARLLAQHLDSLNEARKECERAIQDEIEERLRGDTETSRRSAIVEWGEGWHEGVIGITAGRLAEKYGVPTLVIAVNGERAKGSGRSPENVDLYKALCRCGDLFTKFGGHTRAGGFSLSSENLERLREQMSEAADALRDGPAPVWVDACLSLNQADVDLVRELERMEPFGEANPRPTFLLEGVEIAHHRLVGSSGDHLQLEVEQAGLKRRAIAFRQADLIEELRIQEYRYDLRCQLGRDEFRGQEQLRLQVSGVVEPPCQSYTGEGPVVDLRHLRGRKSALLHWMGEEHGFGGICRQPETFERDFPSLTDQFFTYRDCLPGLPGVVLLTPPQSLSVWNSFLQESAPERLVVLFGCREIEHLIATHQTEHWERAKAVEVWSLLRKTPTPSLDTRVIGDVIGQKVKLSAGSIREILEAFQETEALRVDPSGLLRFGQANGMKLEDTKAFQERGKAVEQLRAVREYFSGPDLAQRLEKLLPELVGVG